MEKISDQLITNFQEQREINAKINMLSGLIDEQIEKLTDLQDHEKELVNQLKIN